VEFLLVSATMAINGFFAAKWWRCVKSEKKFWYFWNIIDNFNGNIFRLKHRGPDWTGCQLMGQHFLGHERLCIVDLNTGNQPLKSHCCDSSGDPTKTCWSIANGEIYNHRQLRQDVLAKNQQHVFASESDCEVITHLVRMNWQNNLLWLHRQFKNFRNFILTKLNSKLYLQNIV